MAKELLLHSKTRQYFKQFTDAPSHAILIYGPAGSGKRTLAERLAAILLDVKEDKLGNYPYFTIVQKSANKQEISIEAIRGVIKQLNLKPVIGSQKPVNRIVLIDEAHLASTEAQNALLKAIEEPPIGTVFILTATSLSAVLPTIASRAESLAVLPVDSESAKTYYSNDYGRSQIDSNWQLSGGTAGLLNALLENDAEHPLKLSVETAKKFLSLRPYERLLVLDNLTADKQGFTDTLNALSRILTVLHHSSIKADNQNQSKRLLESRKLVRQALLSLQNNTSPRLIALNLSLKLTV